MTRLEWVLSGLLALLVIAVTILLLLFWSERRQQVESDATLVNNAPVVTDDAATARSALQQAAPVARQWSDDARLVSALATWPNGSAFASQNPGWTLLFYSVASQATAQISVNAGRAVLLRSHTTGATMQPVALDGWQVDSPQAIDLLLANGGQAFVDAHGDVGLTMTLDANGALRWRARLVDAETGDSLRVELDPVTGAIVDSTASQEDQ